MDIQILTTKGIKLTKHKLAVLKLLTSNKHLDATQIFNLLQEEGINIGIATIYRILTNFENNGIIQKHHFNQEQSTYELITPNEHHDHLICTKCHRVIEFLNENIEALQNQIAATNNFKIISHSLNIYGICEKCQNMSK
ncbi:MAG: Fur family transcriptional regulator [Neisseriaceae bacterium]